MMHFLDWDINLNDSGFLIWNYGGQKQVTEYFSNAERIYLSTSSTISAENKVKEGRGNVFSKRK